MKPIYATKCSFASGTNLGSVVEEVWDWLASGRLGIHPPEIAPGGAGPLTGSPDVDGRWQWLSFLNDQSLSIDVTHPTTAGGRWRTRIWVTDDGRVEGTIRSGPIPLVGVVAPALYQGFRPGIIERWLDRLEVIADGRRLRDTLLRVGPEQAGELVGFIKSSTRQRPIVAVTAPPGGENLLINERFLVRRLGGLAHLVLVEPGATWALTDRLGTKFSVFEGAMRIWWPGFSLGDPPQRHRRWLPWHLMDEHRDCESELSRLVWRASVDAFAAPALDDELRTRVLEADVSKRLARAREAAESIPDEWLAEYESALHQVEDLNDRLETAQDAIADLRFELDEAQQSSQRATEEEVGDEVYSIEDAVRLAASETSHVVFLDAAFKSARESEYPNPAHALADLRALNAVAALYGSNRLPTGGFRAAFDELPVRFQTGISRTARQQFVVDYTISYGGSDVVMGPHLKRGVGSPNRILRIYWYVDDQSRQLVVGHVGRKLRDESNQ